MGRDKPKKFNNMGYFEKERYKDDMAKKYGISGTEYRDSRGNTQTRRNDKALKAAMRNDFDYRTSAQHMDGVKGNASMKDFTKYQRGAVKLHKQAGNGGEFSSAKDITTVTNNLVNDYKKSLTDSMSADKQKAQAESGSSAPLSQELQDARDTVDKFDNKDYGIFNSSTSNGDNQNQRDQAAQAFLGKYKLSLKEKQNL